ncbi:MAG: hypothetical protein A3C83_01305 [Candidatus Ryanbacteria bacterium RIFCSPHIGHO2_02_FULL_47_25]|nr:MAG: hypothetical protein A3C83_01305 [Candidatus Ryanbacteria bacterium RIFCSPHIGHO2_02_FULL_47_25]
MSAVTNGLERGEEFVYEFRLWLGREILFYIPVSAVNAIVIPVALMVLGSFLGAIDFTDEPLVLWLVMPVLLCLWFFLVHRFVGRLLAVPVFRATHVFWFSRYACWGALALWIGLMFLGGRDLKAWVIVPGLLYLMYYFVVKVVPQRAYIGLILIGVHRGSARPAELEKAAATYIRLMAAVIASEMAIGTMALLIPAHQHPTAILLAVLAALSLSTLYIYTGGGKLWFRLIEIFDVMVLFTALFAAFFPTIFTAMTEAGAAAVTSTGTAFSQHWDVLAISITLMLWQIVPRAVPALKGHKSTIFWVLAVLWGLYGYHQFRYGKSGDSWVPATRDAVAASRKCPDVSTLVYHPTAEQFESYADGVPIGCRVRFRFRHEGWAGPFEIGGSPWTLAPGGKHTVRIFKWDGSAVEGTVESLSTDILVTGERASGDDKFASVFPPRRMPMPPARMISVLAGRHTAYQIEKNAGS